MIVSWRQTSEAFKVVLIDRFSDSSGAGGDVMVDFEKDMEYLKQVDLATSGTGTGTSASFTSGNGISFTSGTSFPFIEMLGEDPRLFHLYIYTTTFTIPVATLITQRIGSTSPSVVATDGADRSCRWRTSNSSLRRRRGEGGDLIKKNVSYKIGYDDIIDANFYRNGRKFDEKNWSPFQYNSKLLFIESFSPMHRVVRPTFPDKRKSWISNVVLVGESVVVKAPGRIDITTETDTAASHVFSSAEGSTIAADGTAKGGMTPLEASALLTLQALWPYGEIRGGTTAYLLPRRTPTGLHHSHNSSSSNNNNSNVFLSFFHSSLDPYSPLCSGSLLKTYSMGAYTFEATPPFRILSISRRPIVHPNMYSGPWTDLPVAYYHIDYVVFPTTFIYSPDRSHLYLIYGTQDMNAMVAKLNLHSLIGSLDLVKSIATDTASNSVEPIASSQ